MLKKYLIPALVLIAALALGTWLFLTSGYGVHKQHASAKGISFSYPYRWAVEETDRADGSADMEICGDGSKTAGGDCLGGIGITYDPSLASVLAKATPAGHATFTSLAQLQSYTATQGGLHSKIADLTVDGTSASAWNISVQTGNGEAVRYEIAKNGHYYTITALGAETLDAISHDQYVVINSLHLK